MFQMDGDKQKTEQAEMFSQTVAVSGSQYRANLYNHALEKSQELPLYIVMTTTPSVTAIQSLYQPNPNRKPIVQIKQEGSTSNTVSSKTLLNQPLKTKATTFNQSPTVDTPSPQHTLSPTQELKTISRRQFIQIGEDSLSLYMHQQQSPIKTIKFDWSLVNKPTPLLESDLQSKLDSLST